MPTDHHTHKGDVEAGEVPTAGHLTRGALRAVRDPFDEELVRVGVILEVGDALCPGRRSDEKEHREHASRDEVLGKDKTGEQHPGQT